MLKKRVYGSCDSLFFSFFLLLIYLVVLLLVVSFVFFVLLWAFLGGHYFFVCFLFCFVSLCCDMYVFFRIIRLFIYLYLKTKKGGKERRLKEKQDKQNNKQIEEG